MACALARWSLVLGLAGQLGVGGLARASVDEHAPTAGGASSAGQQGPAASEGADALIARGIALRKAGDDRAALAAFEQAYAASSSAQALAQMALAEQALGRWVPAHLHLERALAVQGDRWIDDHRTILEAAGEEIASRLGQLEVSCNVTGAQVEIDGEAIGRTPLLRAQPVIAGQSVVKVSAPGYFTLTRQVQVDARALARIDVTLTPVPVTAAAAAPPSSALVRPRDADTSGSSTRDVLMYSSLGLGAAGLALGVTGYVVRESNIAVYNDDSKCSIDPELNRNEECPDEDDAWRLGQTLAIVGFASAAVFGGVGLYLWLDRPDDDAPEALACSIGLGGASCSGRF